MYSLSRLGAALITAVAVPLTISAFRESPAQKIPEPAEAEAVPEKIEAEAPPRKAEAEAAPRKDKAGQAAAKKAAGPFEKRDHVAPKVMTEQFKRPGHLGTILREDEKFDAELHKGIGKALKALPVPALRLAVFASLDRPEVRLDGWDAQLLEINADQSTVTIRFTPLVTSTWGASTTVCGCVDETYLYREGQLKLVNSQPRGSSGCIVD